MHHSKQPKSLYNPTSEKKAKNLPPVNAEQKQLQWSFLKFDKYAWHEDQYRPNVFNEIADHMKSYERMTWAQIRNNTGGRDHPIRFDKLTPKAQQRMKALKMDDFEEIWRLRFTGEKRIWGVKIDCVFNVLWWDPEHKVCPSQLQHT